MLNFDYQNTTRIIFGKATHKNVGELIKPYANKILLHYGGGSIKKSGLYDEVINSLRENGIEYTELGGVKPNPRVSLVREGIKLCRKESVQLILAVGGGSVIDSAKAIALGVPYEGDVWDFYSKGLEVKKALPVAAIVTIPAAGSESSWNTVITNEEQEHKVGCRSELLRPVFSIINPELFFTLPANQVANGICDMISHILERYFTTTTKTDLIDGLCESTLRTIIRNAKILNKDPKNYDAWAEIGYAATLAHNNSLGVGREQDWACHGMEHELSAIYDVAHGAGLAVVTPAWMKYVYRENLPIFVQFAINVMGVEGSIRDFEAIALEGINRLETFFAEMGLPLTLKELGIDDDKWELMAKKSTRYGTPKERILGCVKRLNWEDVLKIYLSAQ